MNSEENKSFKQKKVSLRVALISVFVILILALVALTFFVYNSSNRNENLVLKKTTDVIPYPAAVIALRSSFSIKELHENVESLRRFYESQDFSQYDLRVDFSTEDGKKRLQMKQKDVLDKMIEDKAVMLLAKREGVSISQEEIDAMVNQRLEEYGSQEMVEKDLSEKYGWTLDDFKEKVVTPSVYKEKLEKLALEKYVKSETAKESSGKISEEIKEGLSFEEAAKKYSDGSTAEKGGDVGWITKDQLLPKLALSLSEIEEGEISEVIESQIGFHIIRIDEKKNEQGVGLYKLSHIFIRKPTFADWLEKEKKNMAIFIPLGEYKWNSDENRVDFESEKMLEFEKEMLENADGDASLIY